MGMDMGMVNDLHWYGVKRCLCGCLTPLRWWADTASGKRGTT